MEHRTKKRNGLIHRKTRNEKKRFYIMSSKNDKLSQLVTKFNEEYENADHSFSYCVGYVKYTLPTSQDFTIAFQDWRDGVNSSKLEDINGLYTSFVNANYFVDQCLKPLYELGVIDLDKMQSKAKSFASKEQLVLYVYPIYKSCMNWLYQNRDKLVIEGFSQIIGNAQNTINKNFATILLDDYLARKNHPSTKVFNQLAAFKKQSEQIEKA